MRLIDADELITLTQKDMEFAFNNGFLDMAFEREHLIKVIRNQPTAYDIEKVVDELNELDVTAIKRYEGGTFGNYEGTDYYIKKSKAIEIVKHGGVADDVCEWRKHSICGFYSAHEGAVSIINIADGYKYCPYCGKKIKVVE